MERLGRIIAQIRKRKKITQKDLASEAKINYRHFQNIEGDKADIRISTAVEIARALDVPVHVLLHNKINFDLFDAGIESYSALLDHLPIGVQISNVDGKVAFVNKYFLENLTALKEDEMMNDIYMWDLLHGVHKKESKYFVDNIKTVRPPTEPAELDYIGPNNLPIRVLALWKYLLTPNNDVQGFICTLTPLPKIPTKK